MQGIVGIQRCGTQQFWGRILYHKRPSEGSEERNVSHNQAAWGPWPGVLRGQDISDKELEVRKYLQNRESYTFGTLRSLVLLGY